LGSIIVCLKTLFTFDGNNTDAVTPQEEIEQLKKGIKELDEELQDLDLLVQYYSNSDPKWREKVEALIKMKKRAIKLIQILDL
jgi:hypothetical protein